MILPTFRMCAGLLMAIAFGLAIVGRVAAARADEPLIVQARPVSLYPHDAAMVTIGRLKYRGGLVLSSPDPRFGGLSDLRVETDDRMVAVSDRGYWIEMQLIIDETGELRGIGKASIQALHGARGKAIAGLPAGDAESMAPAAAGGGYVLGFEFRPRLWRYADPAGLPQPLATPTELARAPSNEGIEALTRLADGRLLALSEGLQSGAGVVGWIGGAGDWSRLIWGTGGGFRPTAAATMPDGDVLVLERRILPPGARIRLLKRTQLVGGATLRGDVIGQLEGAMTFDNMEGIDVRRRLARDGTPETLIYLVSDDNYLFLQRTLLMTFRLTE